MLQDHIWKAYCSRSIEQTRSWKVCISNMVLEHIWHRKFFRVLVVHKSRPKSPKSVLLDLLEHTPTGSTVQWSWNSMPRPVMRVDPTLCRESYFQFPWNWVKYSGCHKHCQISIHQLEMCKCLRDGGVINNLVCRRFDQWEQRSGLSLGLGWIRRATFYMKSLPVSAMALLWDLVITKDWGESTEHILFFNLYFSNFQELKVVFLFWTQTILFKGVKIFWQIISTKHLYLFKLWYGP